MKNNSLSPYILPILLIPLILLILISCSPQSPVSSSSYDSAHTHYSNGLRLFQNDSLIEALDEYLNALKIMETSDSINYHPRFMMLIHWQLGNLFSSQYMQEPAIVCYTNALNYTGTSEDMPSDYTRLSKLLGAQYHRLQKYDTARYYYHEALQSLPDTNSLDYNQLQFYNAMLDCVTGEADEQYLGKLKKLAAQTSEPYRFTHFITIGEFYYEANQYDSAIVYLKPAFDNINHVELKYRAADFLQNIYQNRGDTLTASQYALYFTKHHEDDRVSNARTSTLNDMFQKHQQWEQQRLQTIEHQHFIKYITLLSILLILPILLILLLKKKKPSSTTSFSSRFSLFEKSEIVILIRERLSKNHDKMSVKNIDEQTKLSLDNAGFVALRSAVDTHFDGLLKNLSTKYPDLNVNDLNCCCLAILGLCNTEMAVLLGVKYNSVTNRLAKIKKILSTEENLHDFLLKTLSYILIIPLILLILFPSQVFAQDTISRSLTLPAATVTADKVTFYRDYKFVMIDFEIVNDRFYILQREKNSTKDFRILVTNMLYEPLDTLPLPTRFMPTNLELDIANNVQIVTQDSMYQIVEIDNRIYYGFPSEKNHYRKVMQNCLFMTDRYVYFCETKIDGYLMKFSRINPKEKTNEIIFVNNDLQKYSEIPHEVLWHERHTAKFQDMWLGPSPEQWEVYLKTAWMRPEQAYLGHSHDTLYYFDHQNRKILTYDEDLNLLHSCEITYPDKETFWRHTMYQDRFSGKFYTVFGTTLNEIDVKTGKTIPKTNANNYLSPKMIIYKGNLYTLKRKRDSSNSEISFIEKTKLY